MKKLEAIIQPFKLLEVKEALAEIGVTTLTVSEVQEADRYGRHIQTYRGQECTVDFTPRTRLEVVVSNRRADEVISVITGAAKTGHGGSGKIFISSLEDAVSIETEKHGEDIM